MEFPICGVTKRRCSVENSIRGAHIQATMLCHLGKMTIWSCLQKKLRYDRNDSAVNISDFTRLYTTEFFSPWGGKGGRGKVPEVWAVPTILAPGLVDSGPIPCAHRHSSIYLRANNTSFVKQIIVGAKLFSFLFFILNTEFTHESFSVKDCRKLF